MEMTPEQIEALMDEAALKLGQAELVLGMNLADPSAGEKLAQVCRNYLATYSQK